MLLGGGAADVLLAALLVGSGAAEEVAGAPVPDAEPLGS